MVHIRNFYPINKSIHWRGWKVYVWFVYRICLWSKKFVISKAFFGRVSFQARESLQNRAMMNIDGPLRQTRRAPVMLKCFPAGSLSVSVYATQSVILFSGQTRTNPTGSSRSSPFPIDARRSECTTASSAFRDSSTSRFLNNRRVWGRS